MQQPSLAWTGLVWSHCGEWPSGADENTSPISVQPPEWTHRAHAVKGHTFSPSRTRRDLTSTPGPQAHDRVARLPVLPGADYARHVDRLSGLPVIRSPQAAGVVMSMM